MELVVAGKLFGDARPTLLEDDEVPQVVQQAPFLEDTAYKHLELRQRFGRQRLSFDRPPGHEPFLLGGERPHARVEAVGDDEQLDEVEQRGDVILVGLQLSERVPYGRLLVDRIFEFEDTDGKTVQEDDYVGPPVASRLDHREL